MKNKTFLYFLSAFLWLGVAFSSFFIFQNLQQEQEQKITVINSSNKIDDLDNEFYALSDKWWERRKLTEMIYIDKRDQEVIDYLANSKKSLDKIKKQNLLNFEETSKIFSNFTLDERYRSFPFQNEKLIANEQKYSENQFSRELYKNILLQSFRKERQSETWKFGIQCGFRGKSQLKLLGVNKIALSISDFDNYTFGYFSFPKNGNGIFTNGTVFKFELTFKNLGRNPKIITKKYRTLPKEGQELKPFDYEEIE